MTPKIPTNNIHFSENPKNIEIQNFEPKIMTRVYVCMKISDTLPIPPPGRPPILFFRFITKWRSGSVSRDVRVACLSLTTKVWPTFVLSIVTGGIIHLVVEGFPRIQLWSSSIQMLPNSVQQSYLSRLWIRACTHF